jgi:hypothetical protein
MGYGGEDVQLHTFFMFALHPAYLPMEWGRLHRRRSGWGGEGREVVCCQPVPIHYTDRAIEAGV